MLSITVSDVLLLLLPRTSQDFQARPSRWISPVASVPNLLLLVISKVPEASTVRICRRRWMWRTALPAAVLCHCRPGGHQRLGALFSLTHPDHPWSEGIRRIAESAWDGSATG